MATTNDIILKIDNIFNLPVYLGFFVYACFLLRNICDSHDIAEILLTVTINTNHPNPYDSPHELNVLYWIYNFHFWIDQTFPLPISILLWIYDIMTCTILMITLMEYLCHKWPRICSTCRKHFPVLSSFTTYYRVCN